MIWQYEKNRDLDKLCLRFMSPNQIKPQRRLKMKVSTEGEIRTRTPLRALRPEHSVSTNSTTSA